MDNVTHLIMPAKTLLDYAEQLGPTFVAIAAIIVTFFLTRRQIIATTLSVSRRQWIDSLIDGLADLQSVQALLVIATDSKEETRHAGPMLVTDARVRLLLDPGDVIHSELLQALVELTDVFRDIAKSTEPTSMDTDPIRIARSRVIAAGRAVIAAEWSRLKQGR